MAISIYYFQTNNIFDTEIQSYPLMMRLGKDDLKRLKYDDPKVELSFQVFCPGLISIVWQRKKPVYRCRNL